MPLVTLFSHVLKRLVILCLVILLASCNEEDECIKAFGDEILTARTTSTFSTLRVSLSALVKVEVDATLTQPEIKLIAQTNIHERISTTVTDGVLDIAYTECIEELKEVDILIRTPQLNRIEIEGPAIIETSEIIQQEELYVYGNASGDCNLLVNVDTLLVESYGSGELRFAGYAKRTGVLLSTSADFYGFDLATDSLVATIQSSGNAQVRVSDLLRVRMNGEGDVLYKESPRIIQDGDGSGLVIDVN